MANLQIMSNATNQEREIKLVIKIDNKKPIELLDLTKSLVAFANNFDSYVSVNGQRKEDRETKLYVKEIKSGSVIFELVEFAAKTAIPFLENASTIIGFAEHLKKAYDFIKGDVKEKDTPMEITNTELKELSQIVNPVANDNGSQINISATVNNHIETQIVIGSLDANALQNIIDKKLKSSKQPELDNDTKTKVLLKFFQLRTDVKAKSGNKGIIDEFSSKPLNIVFEDEKLNEEMLHNDYNPNEVVFVVDVKLQTVSGSLAAYKVVKFHETLDIDTTSN